MQTTLPFISTDSPTSSFEELLYLADEKAIVVEFSQRMKKSWKITQRGKLHTVTIPRQFEHSPAETKKAMIEWAQIFISAKLSRKKLSPKQRERISFLEQSLWTYLHGEKRAVQLRTFAMPHEKFKHCFGSKYDLKVLFDALNERYFEGRLESFLRWGQHASKTSYHTIISDEKGIPHHLITIAGLYNHPSIPQYAIDGVLYHEMLHIACPPRNGKVRRNVHHREFRLREKEYEHYSKWQNWLKKDAQKLLRRMSR